MSLLVPKNLSNAYKGRRQPDKDNLLFACDYPTSLGGQGTDENGVTDSEPGLPSSPQPEPNEMGVKPQTNDENSRKPRAVAVAPVDPLEMLEPDEYGAELGKEARVWKVYVKEADQLDAELVDGWNKSLDVILVFAALFSAVSTAFLIESSGKLQEDPNDVSAAALLAISQTLISMANNSVDIPASAMSGPDVTSSFVPPKHAVIVNTIWYLSLSLSIATSLLAMLAKDWCHSFAANRTGHPWDQALRRQRKWIMIEQWKMQELLVVLPSLIHLSLLLFAVGLCVYVWDLNTTAAIPIVCITIFVFTFYLWSSVMASIVKLFPYTTIISRAFQSDYAHFLYKSMVGPGRRCIARTLKVGYYILIFFLTLIWLLSDLLALLPCVPLLGLDILRLCLPPHVWLGAGYLYRYLRFLKHTNFKLNDRSDEFAVSAAEWINSIEDEDLQSWKPRKSDHNRMTSLALTWLIQNCETPNSVAIALQSIAGASSRIPKEPLRSCHAALQILQRIVSSSSSNGPGSDNRLYTRALTFLGSHSEKSKDMEEIKSTEDIDVLMWDFKSSHEGQVVDLINSRNFSPTPDNITALTIGNNALSLSLRLLKDNKQDVSTTFSSIIGLLLEHIESGNTKFDPAALHSLSNSAVLLTSCSTFNLLPCDLTQKCMDLCLNYFGPGGTTALENVLDPHTALLICILLHTNPPNAENIQESDTSVGMRVERTAHMLMDEDLRTPSAQRAFYRVALFEALFNTELYDTNLSTQKDYYSAVRLAFSSNYLTLGRPLACLIPRSALYGNLTTVSGDITHTSEFLAAVDRVYELVGPLSIQTPISSTLPPPLYCTLVGITCLTHSYDERARCEQLLSEFSFPKLNRFLVIAVKEILPQLWETYRATDPDPEAPTGSWRPPRLQLWGNPNSEKPVARLRHFAAIQLWLLLYLVGDSSTIQQEELKQVVGHLTDLPIQNSGLERVKLRIGLEVIQSYKKDHHFGVYSARAIECILEDQGGQRNDGLSDRIANALQGVSPLLRGLSSFSDHLISVQPNPLGVEPGPPSVPPAEANGGLPSISSASLPIQVEPHEAGEVINAGYTAIPVLPISSRLEDV